MGRTSIEWCSHSWPIINGCARTSPGCSNCYAERLTATRLSKTPKYQGLAVYGKQGPRWTRQHRLWLPHLDMPFRIKAPAKVFTCDMGDLFWEEVSNEEIAAVFGIMAACPDLTFQVLTKRAERMLDWFRWMDEAGPIARMHTEAAPRLAELHPDSYEHSKEPAIVRFHHAAMERLLDADWPLPNVWLGVSVESQKYADERIWALLQTPAAVRWVSAEPLLGPIDFNAVDRRLTPLNGTDPAELRGAFERWQEKPMRAKLRNGLDWVVVGGESGPGARSFDLEWARSIVKQCKDAGCAVFFKQAGSAPMSSRLDENRGRPDYIGRRTFMHVDGYKETLSIRLNDRKGGDLSELPEDIRVREFPSVEAR